MVLVTGKFLSVLSDLINGALRIITEWCRVGCLTVNPDKTTIVHFTRNLKLKLISICLGKTAKEFSDEVKYLGDILDKRLTLSNM